MMLENQNHEAIRDALLDHVQSIFEEMEEEMAMSHQEKYALLEDSLENATDIDELKVAFQQWYSDHSPEVEFDIEMEDIWQQAVAVMVE